MRLEESFFFFFFIIEQNAASGKAVTVNGKKPEWK
jgi:hypothetical protein